jgi:alkylated DNA repair protein (DNA oxidative demethylase)
MRGVVERPTGFRYLPSLLSEDQERDLLEQVRDRQFDEVRMHGHVARRVAAAVLKLLYPDSPRWLS